MFTLDFYSVVDKLISDNILIVEYVQVEKSRIKIILFNKNSNIYIYIYIYIYIS